MEDKRAQSTSSLLKKPRIPQVDLRRQYLTIQKEVDQAIQEVIAQSAFIGNPFVPRFEADFASYVGAKHCVGISSGTAALELALRALAIGPGDEVILPAYTFVATGEAVFFAGATPVFAEIHADSFNINPDDIVRRITPRTRAIIAVDLYGQPADLDTIASIAERHDLWVIEDAAQAHGAEFQGRRVGSLSPVTCFSFYPSKNLGAFGDAGAITTSDDQIAEKVRLLRDHGQRTPYVSEVLGYNHRLDGLQAAVLQVKLKYLDLWVNRRRERAARYGHLLQGLPIRTPRELPGRRHAYHLYVIRVRSRDAIREKLGEAGIATGVHYPIPLHLQPSFQQYRRGNLEITEQCAAEVLSLPLFPELTDDEMDYVTSCLREACQQVR